jgi:hypothetical protein
MKTIEHRTDDGFAYLRSKVSYRMETPSKFSLETCRTFAASLTLLQTSASTRTS